MQICGLLMKIGFNEGDQERPTTVDGDAVVIVAVLILAFCSLIS
jgi:hypothetical protein